MFSLGELGSRMEMEIISILIDLIGKGGHMPISIRKNGNALIVQNLTQTYNILNPISILNLISVTNQMFRT